MPLLPCLLLYPIYYVYSGWRKSVLADQPCSALFYADEVCRCQNFYHVCFIVCHVLRHQNFKLQKNKILPGGKREKKKLLCYELRLHLLVLTLKFRRAKPITWIWFLAMAIARNCATQDSGCSFSIVRFVAGIRKLFLPCCVCWNYWGGRPTALGAYETE